MKTFKFVWILSAMLTMISATAMAQVAPGVISQQRVTMALESDRIVVGASIEFSCEALSDTNGWLWGEDCEGIVIDATGVVVFRQLAAVVAVSPLDLIGGLATPGIDERVTCPGGRVCTPGGRFHSACLAMNGVYEGTNPDANNIPQTWSCTLP